MNMKFPALSSLRTFPVGDPKSIKKTVKSSLCFCTFGICEPQSCSDNIGEINPNGGCNKFYYRVSICFIERGTNVKRSRST